MPTDITSRRLPGARRRRLRWQAVVLEHWHLFDGQIERGGVRHIVVGSAWSRRGAIELARVFIAATTT